MNPHEEHKASISRAVEEIDGLKTMLGMALRKADTVVGSIYQAVGNSSKQSAANTQNSVAAVRDRIPEMVGLLETARAELIRFGGGF